MGGVIKIATGPWRSNRDLLPEKPEDKIKRSIIIMMLQHTRKRDAFRPQEPSQDRGRWDRWVQRGLESWVSQAQKKGFTAEKFDKRITTIPVVAKKGVTQRCACLQVQPFCSTNFENQRRNWQNKGSKQGYGVPPPTDCLHLWIVWIFTQLESCALRPTDWPASPPFRKGPRSRNRKRCG